MKQRCADIFNSLNLVVRNNFLTHTHTHTHNAGYSLLKISFIYKPLYYLFSRDFFFYFISVCLPFQRES